MVLDDSNNIGIGDTVLFEFHDKDGNKLYAEDIVTDISLDNITLKKIGQIPTENCILKEKKNINNKEEDCFIPFPETFLNYLDNVINQNNDKCTKNKKSFDNIFNKTINKFESRRIKREKEDSKPIFNNNKYNEKNAEKFTQIQENPIITPHEENLISEIKELTEVYNFDNNLYSVMYYVAKIVYANTDEEKQRYAHHILEYLWKSNLIYKYQEAKIDDHFYKSK